MLNCLFLASRPGRPKKASKMTSGSLPGPSPRVGKSTKNGPKTRQKRSKTAPRALRTIFHLPLSHPERPPGADLAPMTPQEGFRSPFGTPGGRNLTPGGGRNLTPGASFFGPPGVAFFNLLRTTFARRWGHTMPTMLSRTGPPSDSIRQACGPTAC